MHMQRITYTTILGILLCLFSCDKIDDSVNHHEGDIIVNSPTALYCQEIPETHVTETDVIESLSHEALMTVVDGLVYKQTAVYNCFERNDSIFYIVQPREGIDNNLNCIALLIGEPTRYLCIAKYYITEWSKLLDSASAYHRNYTYNSEIQTFEIFFQAGYSIEKFKVQYVDKEYLVLLADAVFDAKYKHNTHAQFSRIVYKVVDKSELPNCEIIDLRGQQLQ